MKNLADYVMILDDVLSQELCDTLIDKFEKCKERIVTENTWGDGYARRFEELNITEHKEFKEEGKIFYDLTKEVQNFYRNQCKIEFFPDKVGYEAARMKRYDASKNDKFDWHCDVGDYASARRFLVMFYYLNDVEDGGQTVFNDVTFEPEKDLKINPRRGRIVVFPPMWMYPHKALAPISNNKYIISTYCHYL